MNICPNCKQEFRQRKDGCCPNCGIELTKHKNGRFYPTSLGSPGLALLELFERLVSEKTSLKQKKPIVFRISRKTPQFTRELVEAGRLLEMCDGDYDLACATLDILFHNPQFYRIYSSLVGISNDFNLAMAIASVNMDKVEVVDEREALTFQRIMERENVFAR